MHERERHKLILQMVEGSPVATIANLVRATGASEATIRRDITVLERKKLLRRVRGGAESLSASIAPDQSDHPTLIGNTENFPQKCAIARAAVDLCNDGEPIMIGAGSTTFQMAELLQPRRLDVLTNSFDLAGVLLRQSNNRVSVPAGEVHRDNNTIIASEENELVRNFFAKRIFLGARAISRVGVMDNNPQLIRSVQAMIDQAEDVVLLADSSKFQKSFSQLLCAFSRITTIITDDGLRGEDHDLINRQDIGLIVVPCGVLSSASGGA